MKNFIEIILLFSPATGYSLWNGRNGIKHPNLDQVKTVALIMIVCVTLARFHALYYGVSPFVETVSGVLWWYLKAYLVAITGMGLFFPPLMNAVLLKRSHNTFSKTHNSKWSWDKSDTIYCLGHLSPNAWPDKLFLKYKISWHVRLIGYATLFTASVLWFCWSSFRSLESYLH